MASRGKRQRPKDKPGVATAQGVPAARVISRRNVDPRMKRIGRGELVGGGLLLLGAVVIAQLQPNSGTLGWAGYGIAAMALVGALGLAFGGYHLDPRADQPVRTDPRRWIYGGLATAFGLFYWFAMFEVMPNRLPSGMLHLAAIPLFTLMMAAGTLIGQRYGWWIAVVGGSIVLAATIFLIIRMVASAAFLAGVYGAFGKAASTFALVAAALIVELVALLPICQVRFLMARVGRRTYGM
jgi:hypothetical protein